MIIYRTKYKDILSEFAFLEGTTPTHAVILCEGLPTVPKRQEAIEFLAQQGFLVFYPRYRGTWESDGTFLANSPADDIALLTELIHTGNIRELWGDQNFSFQIEQISIIGTSFGGSVALASAAFPLVHKVVALSPVVDFKTLNTTYPEQDLVQLGEFITRAFTHGYRFANNWHNLLKGRVLDLTKAMTKEAAKKIYIVQCKDDSTVNYNPVIAFAKKFSITYTLLPTGGHFSFSKITKELWGDVIHWIKTI